MKIQEFPKISIVTPSFNQKTFLEATIESILSQKYPNLEYIIVDGGSTDGSVEIIKKYEKYLHFWCSEPDNGQYEAINKGFSHANGEVMAWLNSDDMYFPWTLKTVGSIMSELPEVEWLTTFQPGIWDWEGFSRGFNPIKGYSKEAFLDGCYLPIQKYFLGWIQQESTFWRKSLWEKAGGYISTELELASDFELWSRFFSYAELCATSSPLGGFRKQANQKTRQVSKYMSEAKKSLIEYRQLSDWQPNKLRNFLQQKKLYRIAKLNKLFIDKYGYLGKKIIRKDENLPTGYWQVQEYKFL
jgi:glycosyltransferase involved in cell wall biosynthesis